MPVQFQKQCHNCHNWFDKDQYNSQIIEVAATGVRKRVFGCYCQTCLGERPELLPYQFPSDEDLGLPVVIPPA